MDTILDSPDKDIPSWYVISNWIEEENPEFPADPSTEIQFADPLKNLQDYKKNTKFTF
jgi:hypothetical protein